VFKINVIRSRPLAGLLAVAAILALAVSWLAPAFTPMASALQITTRSLTLSSAQPSATGVTYSYAFSLPSNANVQAMRFQACTTAVGGTGGCLAPAGLNINQGSQQGANTFSSTTTFTRDATGNTGFCDPANNVLCIKRTQATPETGAKTIAWNTQTNPSTANTAFFIRMTTYSDVAWVSSVDTGTVASAVVQTLQVSANVAEVLNFCVGSTAIDNATADPTNSGNHDCPEISGTAVNIGTLDPGSVSISPVGTNGGNGTNGIAMLRTNAANGATVAYRAVQAGTGSVHLGTLRLSGATCVASGTGTGSGGTPPAASGPYTDGCIDAAGATQNPFAAGTEQFGMTIAGVNCGSTTSYTCNFSAGNTDLAPTSNYIGNAYTQGTSGTYGSSIAKGYAWDESGSAVTIASSTASPIKQVDDEALIMHFAATPTITTPFGSYSVQADFIAIPGY
jgi:hypothetical protein